MEVTSSRAKALAAGSAALEKELDLASARLRLGNDVATERQRMAFRKAIEALRAAVNRFEDTANVIRAQPTYDAVSFLEASAERYRLECEVCRAVFLGSSDLFVRSIGKFFIDGRHKV